MVKSLMSPAGQVSRVLVVRLLFERPPILFPHFQNLKAGEFPQPQSPDDYNLGDVFLGVEYIFQQCRENEDFYDILTVSGDAKSHILTNKAIEKAEKGTLVSTGTIVL